MAKTKISEFSATPGNNTDIDSINIAEGCAPSGINDAIRELMAQLKDFQTGAVGDSFNGPVGTTTAAAGAFTTLAASGAVTLSGGTANGVPYLNGSKVLTSGSALVFDGTNLGIGTSSPGSFFSSARNLVVGTGAGNNGMSIYSASAGVGDIAFADATTDPAYYSGLIRYDHSLDAMRFFTGSNERLRINSSGNLGLGVPPSAWASGIKAIQMGAGGVGTTALWDLNNNTFLTNGAYFDGTAYKYIASSFPSTRYVTANGAHTWSYAAGGTAGNAITFTQAMTLDASGNLAVGGTSFAYVAANRNNIALNGTSTAFYELQTAGVGRGYLAAGATNIELAAVGYTVFTTNNTERARIDSSGNLLVGVTSGSQHTISKVRGSDAGEAILDVTRQQTGIRSLSVCAVSQEVFSGTGCAIRVGRDASTLRSINAGGTVNASGADYAEYMVKAGEFTIAKGDVVGINADGKLTNVFADAISFCVKSTDPSYVGGDSWGIGFENDAGGLEAARQTVDRIAFAGQVPVNVTGATAGQYIIPVNDNGAIKGEAVNSPTFEQYQQAVGKVIAIEADGRARIIVKVA